MIYASVIILLHEAPPVVISKIYSWKRKHSIHIVIITDSKKTYKKLSIFEPILAKKESLIQTLQKSQFKLNENVLILTPLNYQHLQTAENLLHKRSQFILFPKTNYMTPHSILMKREIFSHLISTNRYIDSVKLFIPQLLYLIKKHSYPKKVIRTYEIIDQKLSFTDNLKILIHFIIYKPKAYFFTQPGNMQGSFAIHKNKKFITHTSLSWAECALQIFRKIHLTLIMFILLLSVLLFDFTSLKTVIISFIVFITLTYFIDLLFTAFLILSSFLKPKEIVINHEEIESFNLSNDWPTYTIFCPLYKEIEVVPQFIKAMKEIDYPKDKLNIIFLLEEDDEVTKNGIESLMLPEYFKISIVPLSFPKTKPKAVNWGLNSVESEYIVIYDAEDVPEADQLKKAVVAFRRLNDPNLICLQAKLNFYNPRQNLLTRMFVGEYSLWFDFILPGLQTVHSPIPLGGTSNHFKRDLLITLKGWDPFNVTEDCDLGVRIFKNGFTTNILDSTTWEEANSNMKNWVRQRSRWIKGYMQTFLVHSDHPELFFKIRQGRHFFSFILIVGGKVVTLFINPLLWGMTIGYFLLRPLIGKTIDSFFPSPIFYLGMFCLVFGNFLYLYSYVLGLAKRGYWDLIKYVIFVPFYWLLMSGAAWVAIYQLIFKPYFWEKTKHGLHLKPEQKEEIEITSLDLLIQHETNQI